MHSSRILPSLLLIVIVFSLAACTTSSPAALATPTSLFSVPPSPVASMTEAIGASPAATLFATQAASSEFTLAVVVDTTTQHITQAEAQAVVAEAAGFLHEFSPIGLLMTDFVEDGNGGGTPDIVGRYVSAHASALPNGIIVFSYGEDARAKTSGGYGYAVSGPAGFRNRFVSPAVGDSQLYVAVVDYSYKYMACGYGGSETVQSAVSLAGECRGQTGIACVSHNGYSMCSNAVGNLYTSTPTHAVSSMLVHGLLHNFGPGGDQDHYATPQCNARMGYPPSFFDLQESEYYNGLCPFVYEDFTKSLRP